MRRRTRPECRPRRDRPRFAGRANAGEPGFERRVRGIDAQRNDVHRVRLPAHRQFGARNERDARVLCGCTGFGKARGFVVIRERIDVHTTERGAAHDGLRRQQAVGVRGMGMQIVFTQLSEQKNLS